MVIGGMAMDLRVIWGISIKAAWVPATLALEERARERSPLIPRVFMGTTYLRSYLSFFPLRPVKQELAVQLGLEPVPLSGLEGVYSLHIVVGNTVPGVDVGSDDLVSCCLI